MDCEDRRGVRRKSGLDVAVESFSIGISIGLQSIYGTVFYDD